MDDQKEYLVKYLKNAFGILFIASFSVFLFILFFQPFPLEMLEYDNRLLFVTGFWAITFLLGGIFFIILPFSLPDRIISDKLDSVQSFVLYGLYLVISATAFSFYIHFVGLVSLSFYLEFKVVLVCFLPLIILVFLYKYKSMKQTINVLHEQIRYYMSGLGEEEKAGEEVIDIVSDDKSGNITLKYDNIIAIKSADNYFEIYYIDNEMIERKLVRGTLKNIEFQLANKANFIRCHRTSIVNAHYIDRLVRSYNGYSLKMNHLEDPVTVSRQYLIRVRDAISAGS